MGPQWSPRKDVRNPRAYGFVRNILKREQVPSRAGTSAPSSHVTGYDDLDMSHCDETVHGLNALERMFLIITLGPVSFTLINESDSS